MEGKEMSFMSNLEYSKINNITFDNIDYDDYPKFTEVRIDSADYDSEPMNEEEIDMLNDNSEFVHEKLMAHLY